MTTSNLIRLTWEEWEEQFKPIQNHVTKREEFNGQLFETFGKDLAYVLKISSQTPSKVWTLFDNMTIGEGYHLVNRMGYFITSKPATKDVEYHIFDEDYED